MDQEEQKGHNNKKIILKFFTFILKIILIGGLILFALATAYYLTQKGKIKKTSSAIRVGTTSSSVTVSEDGQSYKIDETIIEDKETGIPEELLKKFYEAEIVTSYPDLREVSKIGTPTAEGELQGCILFVRDGKILEYKPFKEYQQLLAKFGCDELKDSDGYSPTINQDEVYKSRAEVEANYEKLKTYFTLDKEKNLIIANLSSTEIKTSYNDYAKQESMADEYSYSYKVSIKQPPINYQTQVQKYSMPVEFLTSLYLVSHNSGFCEAIVDLAKNSKIVIEIQDNSITTKTVELYDYESSFYLSKATNYSYQTEGEEIVLDNGEIITIEPETEYGTSNVYGKYLKHRHMANPYRTIETENKENSISLCIKEAKTWIVETSIEYNKVVESPTTSSTYGISYTEDLPDSFEVNNYEGALFENLDGYIDVEDRHALLSLSTFIDNEIPENATVESVSTSIKEKKKEETTIVNTTQTTVTYNKLSPVIEPKEENFLSLLRVDPETNVFNKEDISKNTKIIKYKDESGRTFSPETNILSAKLMLYDFISTSEYSQSYEEIMRYLLYIYTGKSYGVTTLDFSIYEPGDFITITPGVFYGDTIQEKVWFALKNLGYSDVVIAGAMGNIDYESAGFNPSAVEAGGTGEGIGLIQWSYGRREALERYAKDRALQLYGEAKEDAWKDVDIQIEYLIAEISGEGPASGYATRRISGYIKEEGKDYTATYSDWANSTTIEDSTLAFMRFFESPSKRYSYDHDYTESGKYVGSRLTRAKKYYDEFKGMGGTYSSGKEIITQHISSITGRTFTAYNQLKIAGWGGKCNRAAFISVCSGYYSGNPSDLVSIANNIANSTSQNIVYNSSAYRRYGLKWQYGQSDLTPEVIKKQLLGGGYILTYLKGSDAGHSGRSKYPPYNKWAGTMHWVAIIDYKYENGKEWIYVTDSGHGHTGWHPINEFDGMVHHTLFINEL